MDLDLRLKNIKTIRKKIRFDLKKNQGNFEGCVILTHFSSGFQTEIYIQIAPNNSFEPCIPMRSELFSVRASLKFLAF